nr:hypothetical protein [Escherichia coli]
MNRSHWTHRTPCKAARCVLALFLVMLLPVGCTDINRAGQLFDAAAQVCRIVDSIRQCSQN